LALICSSFNVADIIVEYINDGTGGQFNSGTHCGITDESPDAASDTRFVNGCQ
jgi:hypothetical protein